MRILGIMFLSTLALLTAVKTDLAGRHYSQSAPDQPPVLSTSSSHPFLFERLEFYSNKNAAAAIAALRLFENRIGLLVPVGDDYANEKRGNELSSERTTDFMVCLLDKDFSADTGRLVPGFETPGILGMKDLTVQALTEKAKKIVDNSASPARTFIVGIEPGPGGPVTLEWREKGAAEYIGRECWGQVFRANNLGVHRISIGRV